MRRGVEGPKSLGDRTEHGLSHWEGEPLTVWEALWGVPRFEAYSRLGSTNDRIRELAAAGAPGFTVVTAEEQTAGRGRSGRPWASAASKGLWISILLDVPLENTRPVIPILIGLAVCRAVERAAPDATPTVKWPNDVLLGDRKLCGVLCEAVAERGIVAGVGLNLGHRPGDFPVEVRPSAVSLEMATGRSVSRSQLAGDLLGSLRDLLSRPDPFLGETVMREVERRDALRGRRVRVDPGPSGVAAGIDEDGALLVGLATGGVVRVVAGSVTILEG